MPLHKLDDMSWQTNRWLFSFAIHFSDRKTVQVADKTCLQNWLCEEHDHHGHKMNLKSKMHWPDIGHGQWTIS